MGRLDAPIRGRIGTALDRLSADPRSGELRKLVGRPEWRLRVGDWRVLVELELETHTIRVAPHTAARACIRPLTGTPRR